jgi:membrane associated rhomboid family serine protease
MVGIMDDVSELKELSGNEWQAIFPEHVVPGMGRVLDRQTARLWSLVLDSRGVPCCIDQGTDGLELLIPRWHLERAYDELRRFIENNRGWPSPLPPSRPVIENTIVTLSVLVLLAAFYNVTGLHVVGTDGMIIDWHHAGSGQAGRVLDGEWWRLVTALTLHGDVVHLISNLAIGGLFIWLLCRELGSGLTWFLLLVAGVAGNLFNSLLQSRLHDSVGASTAVFGAVGILSALSLVRYRHFLSKRWPLPVAAALALLSILGSEGKHTDLGAHLFGLLAGLVIGLLTETLIGRYGQPGRRLNALLGVLTGLIAVTAWMMALVC